MQKTLTLSLSGKEKEEILEFLSKYGDVLDNRSEYVDWHVKGNGFSGVMYKSGKFVLQISDSELEKNILGKLGKNDSTFKPHIGSDEVGKGDFFGPLVVCACYISMDDIERVNALGAMDSKKIKDENILTMGKELVQSLEYEVSILLPADYNERIKELNNVSILLAKMHVETIGSLVKKLKGKDIDSVVVDQFSKSKSRLTDEFNLKIPLKQFHHGESDVAVACASIIARYYFLLEFKKMNEKYEFKFPLGATHVIDRGKEFVEKFGVDELKNVAKISFKTTDKVLSLF